MNIHININNCLIFVNNYTLVLLSMPNTKILEDRHTSSSAIESATTITTTATTISSTYPSTIFKHIHCISLYKCCIGSTWTTHIILYLTYRQFDILYLYSTSSAIATSFTTTTESRHWRILRRAVGFQSTLSVHEGSLVWSPLLRSLLLVESEILHKIYTVQTVQYMDLPS